MKLCIAAFIAAGLISHAEAVCRIPYRLTNGKVKCQGDGEPGSVCIFTCNAGYERVGAARIECRKDWNAEPPTCEPICDPMPAAPKYGYKTCHGCGSLGTECTFDCKPGYELQGSESTVCQRIGRGAGWSDPTPICKKEDIKCKDIVKKDLKIACDNPKNGEGTVCTFKCDKPGFELIPHAKKKTECVKNGTDENGKTKLTWTVSPPCCVDCTKIKKDIVIAIDASDSLTNSDWVTMKSFVSNVVGKFKVGDDAVKFEIFQFSSGFKPLDPFKRGKDFFRLTASEIKAKLRDKSWTKEAFGTRTGGALKIAQRYFLNPGESGNREKVPDMVWVFTDGAADDQSTLENISKSIRASGVNILALAIGKYKEYMPQMIEMTGSRSKVLVANNFSALTQKLVKLVSTKICEETCYEEMKFSANFA